MLGSAAHLATLRNLKCVSRMPDGDRGQQRIPWADVGVEVQHGRVGQCEAWHGQLVAIGGLIG